MPPILSCRSTVRRLVSYLAQWRAAGVRTADYLRAAVEPDRYREARRHAWRAVSWAWQCDPPALAELLTYAVVVSLVTPAAQLALGCGRLIRLWGGR